ncbi:MAG: class I SAM-dependent methyltransferase [Chitinophagaceae bacterium]|nr:class I SAM-dependent methyltransferase [Chitinophagaceae bacterium]
MTEETIHIAKQKFEQLYFSLREKEGRIYTDEQLLHLPDVKKDHPHFAEWQLRNKSYLRLKNYLAKRVFPVKILEVGCGNGWLSHRLSFLPGACITGIDINSIELHQAKRVFSHISNLHFINTAIDMIGPGESDHIIFAASIQYFSSLKEILDSAIQKLKPQGEIHILDTHFYNPGEIAAAKARTVDHFTNLGFPEMSSFYFHHTMDELSSFKHEIIYQPSFFQRQFNNNKNPFPWICIKNA